MQVITNSYLIELCRLSLSEHPVETSIRGK